MDLSNTRKEGFVMICWEVESKDLYIQHSMAYVSNALTWKLECDCSFVGGTHGSLKGTALPVKLRQPPNNFGLVDLSAAPRSPSWAARRRLEHLSTICIRIYIYIYVYDIIYCFLYSLRSCLHNIRASQPPEVFQLQSDQLAKNGNTQMQPRVRF